MHRGDDIHFSVSGGENMHRLTLAEIPKHNHRAVASAQQPDSNTPANNFWASNTGYSPYGKVAQFTMSPDALSVAGADVPHNNMAPYLALNICICVKGQMPNKGTSDQFLAEIRIFPGLDKPRVFIECDGELEAVSQNTALFSLLSSTYGGNGTTNFGLPNIKGRAPLMAGQGQGLLPYDLGEDGGESMVPLTEGTIPKHTHSANANQIGNSGETKGKIWANPATSRPQPNFYATNPDPAFMLNENAIGTEGSNQPHNNLMPYTAFRICIATDGFFPERG
jgi:microcystin-dependent protein